MFTNIVNITLISCMINGIDGGWKNTLKDINERAKQKFRNKYGDEGTKNFLGHDVSKYPGTNEYLRNLNKDKWTTYYECLSAQENNLRHHKAITPIAVVALESSFVKLECTICLSPDNINDNNINSVEWHSALGDDISLHPVEYDEHILVSPVDKSLMMYNLRLEQTGQYMCSLGETLTAPYFVTVIKSFESDIKEVHPEHAKHGPYPTLDLIIPEHTIRLSTNWGPWSPCSQCGKIGKKHRYGFCNAIYSSDMNSQMKRAAKPMNHLQLLRLFQEGIPCSSHILSKEIQRLEAVKARKDEMMIAFCQEECTEDKLFEVRDEHGNVLEQANNSAGVYSMLQGMPPAEPHIEKSLEYRKADSDIILSCPGNLNSDAPIQWQIGQKIVVPELIVEESQGRVFVGLTDRIHIKHAKVSDTNIYRTSMVFIAGNKFFKFTTDEITKAPTLDDTTDCCWQHKELAGIVRLIVEKKINLDFNHHVMMFALIIILSTFLWVLTKAFFGRKYARIKD